MELSNKKMQAIRRIYLNDNKAKCEVDCERNAILSCNFDDSTILAARVCTYKVSASLHRM